MDLKQINEILQATGYPVAYSHFEEVENQPIPKPPFICYLEAYASHFSADNVTYKKITNVQIELYTDKKDLLAEAKVEAALTENEIPFVTTETYIESEKLYQKIYEVRFF